MSNQERAAEVIGRHMDDADAYPMTMDHRTIESVSTMAAQALADTGLLMPELPEPDDASIFVPNGAGWRTPQDSTVWTAIGGRVMIQRVEPGNFTPGEARSFAYALLAAAKLAEEQE